MTEQGSKYLYDILQAIDLIENFTSAINGYENYLSDLKTQSAVERQLAIIGEAANLYGQLFPDNTINTLRKIVGLRNRLVHAYDAIDTSIVWAILKNHLPVLKKEVQSILCLE
ncbi:MAG: DUF86 domain-containing protein [Dysgonamonadaceae bacterium]|jgi:uncharacterized protein with HEPN domain|nr:DUF86 domain-containing protein [Dysgonamonadaceae bacterium]